MPIEVRGLTKSYGDFEVFRGLDLDIADSSVTALLGPSGCGKTTLLDIIAGITTADSGVIAGSSDRSIGYVFQEPLLLPWKTVAGNIEFVLKDHYGREERAALVGRWMSLVGLDFFAGYYPHELSGGMRQRVGIARAFAYPSTTILLDEPFQGLDVGLRRDLAELFDRVWRSDRRTAVIVTHDIGEAMALADEVYLLSSRPARVVAHYSIAAAHGERSPDRIELVELEREITKRLGASGAGRSAEAPTPPGPSERRRRFGWPPQWFCGSSAGARRPFREG